ncbi:imidazolonepropionase [Halovivax gelatinilyticus]|uniref:imidazolonepropionase n=1 Tax=Halovivax gelatinilyticus TaxID=2961597 RepID=UPI0020CA4189|nr:imidazolonepropionase [Halovivax gelatinilyticus]
MPELDAVIYDAAEIVVGPEPSGGDSKSLQRYEDAAVAIVDGVVESVGTSEAVIADFPPENATTAIDAAGKSVIPGFVDSHTHAVFAGDRSDEYAARLRGADYQEILAEGGGILRTVRAVRDASDDQLLANLQAELDVALEHGSTTVEVKSGYGLDTESELRLLEAIDRADRSHPVDVVATFMGAHAIPDDEDAAGYTERVIDDQLPAVAEQGIATFCDVFCEEDVFTPAQSRRVLTAGRDHGLVPKIHAEEFAHTGGARVGADVSAASADHLLQATEDDAEALADAGVVATLLPAAAFSLDTDYADPATFESAGATVALASDFNPNCHSQSMGFTVALACSKMKMTPESALAAATHGGAAALTHTDGAGGPVPAKTGTLRPGAPGDALVLDAPSHVHVPYSFGVNRVETVLKGGDRVHG